MVKHEAIYMWCMFSCCRIVNISYCGFWQKWVKPKCWLQGGGSPLDMYVSQNICSHTFWVSVSVIWRGQLELGKEKMLVMNLRQLSYLWDGTCPALRIGRLNDTSRNNLCLRGSGPVQGQHLPVGFTVSTTFFPQCPSFKKCTQKARIYPICESCPGHFLGGM